MRTINVSISDLEYNKFGIKTDKISFSEFVDLVSKEISKQTLNKSLRLAQKFGLSDMTMNQISKEVKAVRKNAKSNR
jgi:hypothetical protein